MKELLTIVLTNAKNRKKIELRFTVYFQNISDSFPALFLPGVLSTTSAAVRLNNYLKAYSQQ